MADVGDRIRAVSPVPLGTFHAVKTLDAVARTRDGWPFFEANLQGRTTSGELLFEILFGDGEWMLAVADDLVADDL